MSVSVLMAVYEKEKAEYFHKSLESINNQTRRPDRVIVVEDGPLTKELKDVVSRWQEVMSDTYVRVILPSNRGLAVALNEGLAYCLTDYIARMDTDDIAEPRRLELQAAFLDEHQEVDVLGSNICEIDETDKIISPLVAYPHSNDECREFFKIRAPVAHPATMIRKKVFEHLGGYQIENCRTKGNEDLLLWADCFAAGFRFSNLQEVLLRFRRSKDSYYRRSGFWKTLFYLKDRLRMNSRLRLGMRSHLFALGYCGMLFAPRIVKKFLYRYAR